MRGPSGGRGQRLLLRDAGRGGSARCDVAGGEGPLRVARRGCGLAYVDTSRNGRRAYCSVRCANNDAVARHREQRRSAGRAQ
ncbi:CGNR zinc finger domain-containing protein, partial [Streptomyces hainanensis]|uniref:CGNR zinc finger domain-containing protein n=1 Tax=Streptomyces hainanensis TaxID=402648 RepID=UPI003C79FE0F